MADKGTRKEILPLLYLLALGTVSRLIFLTTGDAFYDDAYTTFRFVRNIVNTGLYGFNPGEEVYGASSPLYTLFLSFARMSTPEQWLPTIAGLTGALSLVGLVALVWFQFPFSRAARFFVAGLLLLYPRIFYASLGGMEECTISFFMVLAAVFVLRKMKYPLGITWGVLLLLKIDTLPWIVVTFATSWYLWKRLPWKEAVVGLLVYAPWAVWAMIHLGSLIPHTVFAKQIAYPRLHPFTFVDFVSFPSPESIQTNISLKIFFGSLMYTLLLATALRAWWKRDWFFLMFPLYGVLYTALLVFSGTDIGLWERWAVPMWVLLLIGVGYLFEGFRERFAERGSRPVVKFGLIGLLSLGFVVPVVYPNRKALDPASFVAVCDWLNANARVRESVMLEPIGLIGYSTDMYVHDFIGLVSPAVTTARRNSGMKDSWFAGYLKTYQPDYVILRTDELAANKFSYGGYGGSLFTPADSLWFAHRYVRVFETKVGPRVDWFVIHHLRSFSASLEP